MMTGQASDHCTPTLCKICDTPNPTPRECKGYRTLSASWAGKNSTWTVYDCKYAKEAWHNQIRFILATIEKCPSAALVKLMEEEIKEIIATKTPSIPSNGNNWYCS